jgi:hypothetical protein
MVVYPHRIPVELVCRLEQCRVQQWDPCRLFLLPEARL